ncbi:MAG: hypothetical protein AB8B83_04675 [Bdellovibrionales bacterium]
MKKKTMISKNNQTHPESGNVLFLILIAVALFAALSYAVTSSSRSGGGDANEETNLISSSTVTQYPASVRTSIIRMQVTDGVSTSELEFNAPVDFANCGTYGGVLGANCVFHPDGGQATYVPGSADVMTSGNQTNWIFSSNNEVNLVGRTAGGNAAAGNTAEVIAFLIGIREGVCSRINEELGIAGIPTEASIELTTAMVNADGTVPGGVPGITADAAGGDDGTIGEGAAAALDGQAFGCFQQPAGTYIYYHVLLEQ